MNKLAIIICQYKRTHLLKNILENLNNQTFKNFDLFIWNNNFKQKRNIDDIVDKNKKDIKTTIYHSRKNFGGMARFFISEKIDYKFNIFIDDDQIIKKYDIEKFNNEKEEKTILSQWAWKLNKDYRDRKKCKYKEKADYCGTGGMIIDSSIFKNYDFWKFFPKKYYPIEDLYLSYYASYLGWNKFGSSVNLEFYNGESNSSNALWKNKKIKKLKHEFYKKYFLNK